MELICSKHLPGQGLPLLTKPAKCLPHLPSQVTSHTHPLARPAGQIFKSLFIFFSCFRFYLLLLELLLYFFRVAGIVDYGLGQLWLNVSQPGPQAAHVLVQLLDRHQSLLQLLDPVGRKRTSTSEKGPLVFPSEQQGALGLKTNSQKPKSTPLSHLLAVWLWAVVWPSCASVSSSIKWRCSKSTCEI